MAENFDREASRQRHDELMRRLQDIRNDFSGGVIDRYWDRLPDNADDERAQRQEVASRLRQIRNDLGDMIDRLVR